MCDFDLVSKAETNLICYKCNRKIPKGEYVGLIAKTQDNRITEFVPFCLRGDCNEVQKNIEE